MKSSPCKGRLQQGKQVYHVTAQIDPNCAMPIAAQQLLLKALAETGEVLGTRPEAGSAKNAMQFQLLVASDQTVEFLTAKCRIPTIISQVKVESIGTPAQKPAQKSNGSEAGPKPSATQGPVAQSPAAFAEEKLEAKAPVEPIEEIETPIAPSLERDAAAKPSTAPAENLLSVDAERIDTVLNLVGELIIGKSMLQQATQRIRGCAIPRKPCAAASLMPWLFNRGY